MAALASLQCTFITVCCTPSQDPDKIHTSVIKHRCATWCCLNLSKTKTQLWDKHFQHAQRWMKWSPQTAKQVVKNETTHQGNKKQVQKYNLQASWYSILHLLFRMGACIQRRRTCTGPKHLHILYKHILSKFKTYNMNTHTHKHACTHRPTHACTCTHTHTSKQSNSIISKCTFHNSSRIIESPFSSEPTHKRMHTHSHTHH